MRLYTHLKRIISLGLILFLTLSQSGCLVMLAKGGAHFDESSSVAVKKNKQTTTAPHVYTMRGWLGIFSTGMDDLAKRVTHELGWPATAMSYHEKNKLIKHIVHAYHRDGLKGGIILVGHSFGADAQVKVAEALAKENIPVKLLIAVEPTAKQTIPPNVKAVYQIASGKSLPKTLAGWGKPYDKFNQNTSIKQLDVAIGRDASDMHHFNMTTRPKTLTLEMDLIKQAAKHPLNQTRRRVPV